MKNLMRVAIGLAIGGVVFVGGVAVGKATKEAKFLSREEVKWVDTGEPGKSPKFGLLSGDEKKGPYLGLLQIPNGFTSPFHSHSGDYESVQIEGTSSHWLKGEDGTKAKPMTPGSYWSMPGKLDHVSGCAKGKDCVVLLMQKTKFDFVPGKEDKKPADTKAPAKTEPAKTAPAKTEPAKKM